MGTNFATSCDLWGDRLVVTGHRGFNDSGSEIKLWDLRHLD